MTLFANMDRVRGTILRDEFAKILPHLTVVLVEEALEKKSVRYLLTWDQPEDIKTAWPSLEIIFVLGAGADHFKLSEIPPDVQVVRLVSKEHAAMMQEYVTLSVLALHRDIPEYINQQHQKIWRQVPAPPLPSDRRIGVMGLGNLGKAVLKRLAPFGFSLSGWARRQHNIDGVTTFYGTDGLELFLKQVDILICLLPLTKTTKGILNYKLFSTLPQGSALIHVGRGQHLNHQDLIRALESEQLRAAVIDVTEPEPLPEDHPLWSIPRVILTPHIACITRIEACIPAISENIKRHQKGKTLNGVVDSNHGY